MSRGHPDSRSQANRVSAGPSRDRRRAGLALAILSLIWGYNWIAMKLTLADATPADSAASRFLLGALALLPAVGVIGFSAHPAQSASRD